MVPGVIVLMGGGLDSSCLALLLSSKDGGRRVLGMHFDYGQPAFRMEARATRAIADYLCIPLTTSAMRLPIHEQDYELKGRNLLFLLAAAPTALSEGFGQLALGIHKGSRYYDASPAFFSDAQRVFDGYFGGRIVVTAPFLDITKPEIWEIARAEGLPIDRTYSCLEGCDPPCGYCPSCGDRQALNERYGSVQE